jgi:acyl dehydratase
VTEVQSERPGSSNGRGCVFKTSETVEGLRCRVGEQLGTSAWQGIDQGMIDTFARVTRDEQWIHVDRHRASIGPFGGTITHGYLTLSLCSHFLAECVEVEGVQMTLNYGLNRVRFPSAVPAGAHVRGRALLLSLDDIDGGVQAVIRMTVETDRGEKPSCVADLVIRYYHSGTGGHL